MKDWYCQVYCLRKVMMKLLWIIIIIINHFYAACMDNFRSVRIVLLRIRSLSSPLKWFFLIFFSFLICHWQSIRWENFFWCLDYYFLSHNYRYYVQKEWRGVTVGLIPSSFSLHGWHYSVSLNAVSAWKLDWDFDLGSAFALLLHSNQTNCLLSPFRYLLQPYWEVPVPLKPNIEKHKTSLLYCIEIQYIKQE